MSKFLVFRTLKSKSRYWTLFWPKYCASAGRGVSHAAAAAAAAASTAAGRGNGGWLIERGSFLSLKHQSAGDGRRSHASAW